ncbi:MAG: M15 family metallopeptidase [Saprospiraceae bacterium]|nr:M15 family metallopeptidase [Saprospiraceae bacterium]
MKIHLLLLLTIFACQGPSLRDANHTELSDTGIILTASTRALQKDTIPTWSIAYIMGKFDPALDTNFIVVDRTFADREGLYLRKDTYEAFKKMHAAAQQEGVSLIIRSATRNFDYQKGIWERKWTGETPLESNKLATGFNDLTTRAREILKYSSMPGSSRHHWGTDMDLNAFSNQYFEHGEGKKIYDWLTDHASQYGFCQPYTDKATGRTGYEEERWHWSYLPISWELTQNAKKFLKDTMIDGFKGAEEAVKLGIVDNYVMGIDSSCLSESIRSNPVNN